VHLNSVECGSEIWSDVLLRTAENVWIPTKVRHGSDTSKIPKGSAEHSILGKETLKVWSLKPKIGLQGKADMVKAILLERKGRESLHSWYF